MSKKDRKLGAGELAYAIDNRDSKTTWLQVANELGYIELTLDDLFGLIENMIDNATEADRLDMIERDRKAVAPMN